jgi:GPH family glycoside/pentoside/hexuronide:cation symporter
MLVGLFETKRMGFGMVGIIFGILAAAALLISASGIKEKKYIVDNASTTPPLQAIKLTFQNKYFVRLIISYFIVNLSFAFIKTLMAYFVIYQLKMEEQVTPIMGLLLITVVVFIFPWKKLSEKWDKGPAYALGMGIGGLAVAMSFFLPDHSTPWIYVIAIVAGIGFASNWVFPWSMVPDVVDFDRLNTGEYRSGMYFGVWGLATKLSEAIALAASGWLLTLFGYVANMEQTSQTLLGIRLFFGPIPAIVILIGLPLLIWFPIIRVFHQNVLRQINQSHESGVQGNEL